MIMKNFTRLARQWLWLAIVLVVVTANFSFAPTAIAQSNAPQLTVVGAAVSVREGPGMTYPAITYLLHDAQATVIGYDADSDWWQVELSDGTTGWANGRKLSMRTPGWPWHGRSRPANSRYRRIGKPCCKCKCTDR